MKSAYRPNIPSRPLSRRLIPFFCIFIILFLISFLFNLPHRITPWNYTPTPTTTTTTTSHNIPSPLSAIYTPPTFPVHHFTVPRAYAYYNDVLPQNHTKLYLITGGIMMPESQRNLNAVACLVGQHIYPAQLFIKDVIHCLIDRPLRVGERLVPVLAWDDRLKRATEGPETLVTGVVVELKPGDLLPVPPTAVFHGDLATAKHEDFRLVRSQVTVGPSDAFLPAQRKELPRFRLCLMTQIKPMSYMLQDWADYHRRIGVDHVYIFDNGAALDLKNDVFADRLDVEIIDWPYHKSHYQVLSWFVYAARSRCERVMIEDTDEYPMFGLGDGSTLTTGMRPLIRYAKEAEREGFPNFMLLFLLMSNSGFLRRQNGTAPEKYIHRLKKQGFTNGKSVCHMDLDWLVADVHYCGKLFRQKTKVYKLKIDNWGERKMTPEQVDDPPYLMHFRHRSWEEHVEKWKAGRGSGNQINDDGIKAFDVNKPPPYYMEVSKEYEYTHFRDNIYPRVMREGRMDEQTVVQIRDGKRCETVYVIEGRSRRLMREECLVL